MVSGFSLRTCAVVAFSSLGLMLACSASQSSPERAGADSRAGAENGAGGAPVSGAGAAAGVTGIGGIAPAGGTGGGAADWIPDDLPAPWAYYDEGTDRAYKDPALGTDVRTVFGGEPATEVPRIVYPLDGAMHPVNLSHLRLQWHRGATTNKVYRVDVSGSDGRTSRFFVPCNAVTFGYECTYQMPASDWLWLGADYAGSEVSISISATDGAGGPVGTSEPIKAHFSPEPVYGALYYWAASQNALKRANFNSTEAVPFITPESETNQFKCVACHSVSRDGKVLAFAVSNMHGETVGAIQTAPTEDPARPYVAPQMGTSPFTEADANVPSGGTLEDQPLDHFGHNVALSPDGAIAAVNGISTPEQGRKAFFELRDTVSGDTLTRYEEGEAPFAAGTMLIQPEWSPDGQSIVGAVYHPDDPCRWTYTTSGADIAVFPVVGGSSLGSPKVIATNSDPAHFHFYPTWSADGKWVAFMSAKREAQSTDVNVCGNTNSSFQQNAVIRMVRVDGNTHTCPGADCIELTRGTQYSVQQAFVEKVGKHSTWPKFTPFAQGEGDSIMFISLTSGIDYGWISTKEKNNGVYARNQIWMFGVDVSKASAGDPSYAPIWLPQQDPGDGSLTPYWTETLPCQSDPGGACVGCAAGEECHVSSDNTCECRGVPVK